MRLSDLLQSQVTIDMEIKGISSDSRVVKDGYLFVALPGSKENGNEYIKDAARNGAVAVLTAESVEMPLDVTHLSHVVSKNPRRTLSLLASRFYEHQPDRIVAVTGTNGKTSTVNFCQQLWQLSGRQGVSMGTLGLRGAGIKNDSVGSSMTTPDPVKLHENLKDLHIAGVTHVAMEASSHGLDQCRLDGVHLNAVGFTNLTRDHLDYHLTMENYLGAKKRLFRDLISDQATVVINADSEHAGVMSDVVKFNTRMWFYGIKGRDFQLLARTPTATGQDLTLSVFGRPYKISVPLVGSFQVMNLLCALGLCASESPQEIGRYLALLPSIQGVDGRLQLVAGHKKEASVFVDYAHTPDALETVLTALRPHTTGKLVCLFGCGGDRDKGKRPIMGMIAASFADTVIVTDDNPRTEAADLIRASVMEGCPDAKNIPGRREAIRYALSQLEKGDVLVIAGKGHEQGQIIGTTIEPFDDVTEARKAMQEN